MSVALIATGGTIASTSTDGADAEPELDGADLAAAVPQLGDVTELSAHEFSKVPSPQFTLDQMADLVTLIQDLNTNPDVDGIVVTQGTDILEETAYFVDLCYDGATPVAFTGAMRNPSVASPDGPGNLLSSVRTVLDDTAGDPGVLVVFNDRIHAARDVTKMHSMNTDTFRTPEFGPLGVIDEGRVVWMRTPTRSDPTFDIVPEQLTNDIHAVTATAEMPPAQLTIAMASAGLCLAATGAGHVPDSIVPALEDVVGAGVPLVVTTRCPEGRLARATYGFRGSEATLQDLGAFYSDVNLQKTRIRTSVAIAADRLDDAFERP